MGIHDHFGEIGGDSIKILHLISELQKSSIRIGNRRPLSLSDDRWAGALRPPFHTGTGQGPVTGIARRLSATRPGLSRETSRATATTSTSRSRRPARSALENELQRRPHTNRRPSRRAAHLISREEGPAIWQEFHRDQSA